MSERGTFVLDRRWFDHPAFKDERYTEREAWAWLIAQAAYVPHRRRIAAAVVDLARGQMAASLRFMADKWKWKEPRVRRFLKRLKTDAMIDAATDAGVTVITIRNYDRYQRPIFKSDAFTDAANDAASTQHRRKEEIKKIKEIKDDVVVGAREAMISPEAHSLAAEVANIAGFPDPKNWPPGWCGASLRAQTWINADWEREVVLAACRQSMAKKRDGPPNSINYFEKAIAVAVAQHGKPLPKVIEQSQEVIHAQETGVRPRGQGFGALSYHLRRRQQGDPSV